MWVAQRHEAEDDARAESGRHGLHRQRLLVARDAEDAELASPVNNVHLLQAGGGDDAVRVQVCHEIEWRLFEVEHVLRVLVVTSDTQVRIAPDVALCRLDFLLHELE